MPQLAYCPHQQINYRYLITTIQTINNAYFDWILDFIEWYIFCMAAQIKLPQSIHEQFLRVAKIFFASIEGEKYK